MKADFDSMFPTINTVTGTGKIRCRAEDFVVIEHHDMSFTGSGEHLWLHVKKISSNTAWVATQLASACKVPARQVGFAGLKDRHAITQQWFSVQHPKITDIEQIKAKLPETIQIIDHQWHQRKIKTGQLKHNEFRIVVRELDGTQQQIENNIERIKVIGVPNYFGKQRFGHNLNNIQQAKDWFTGEIRINNRNLRGLLISTARSHLFNLIVAHRIENNLWQKVIPGDLIQLNQSHSWFPANEATEVELQNRLDAFDIHITAALWGEDNVQSSSQCASLENNIRRTVPEYQEGFINHRVKQDRRAMRVLPTELNHNFDTVNNQHNLHLSFKLPPGAYATCVLREIMSIKN